MGLSYRRPISDYKGFIYNSTISLAYSYNSSGVTIAREFRIIRLNGERLNGHTGNHKEYRQKNNQKILRVYPKKRLLPYYSKGRDNDKIEIDYLQKKNVKKPNGSAPGFVVYYTNYSLTIHPDISGLTLIE